MSIRYFFQKQNKHTDPKLLNSREDSLDTGGKEKLNTGKQFLTDDKHWPNIKLGFDPDDPIPHLS